MDLLLHPPLEDVVGQVVNVATDIDTPIIDIARRILTIAGKGQRPHSALDGQTPNAAYFILSAELAA